VGKLPWAHGARSQQAWAAPKLLINAEGHRPTHQRLPARTFPLGCPLVSPFLRWPPVERPRAAACRPRGAEGSTLYRRLGTRQDADKMLHCADAAREMQVEGSRVQGNIGTRVRTSMRVSPKGLHQSRIHEHSLQQHRSTTTPSPCKAQHNAKFHPLSGTECLHSWTGQYLGLGSQNEMFATSLCLWCLGVRTSP